MDRQRLRLLAALPPRHIHGEPISPPMGALIIASVLERLGTDVEFIDFQLAGEDPQGYDIHAMARAVAEGPRVVGISTLCDALPVVALACEEAKRLEPNKVIVLGGPGPASVAVPLMQRYPSIDVVVVGEGEATAYELFPLLFSQAGPEMLGKVAGIVYRNGSVVIQTPPRSPIMDLDSVPLPAYHLVNLADYQTVGMVTSRGCPYQCKFCSTSPLWGRKVRYRSAAGVAAEIEFVRAQRGGDSLRLINFADDLFTSSAAHVRGICGVIKRIDPQMRWGCLAHIKTLTQDILEMMCATGCEGLAIGVESGSDHVLRSINKDIAVKDSLAVVERAARCLRELKLFFMWGFPFETRTDLMQTIMLIRQIVTTLYVDHTDRKLTLGLGLAAPLPGSALEKEYNDRLLFDPESYFSLHGMASRSFLKATAIRNATSDEIRAAPEVFSAYYRFAQAGFEEKAAMVAALQLDRIHVSQGCTH